jgi:hypothetical protein
MAEPLTGSGAIPLLEESVQVLRQAPFSTLLCHWTGSVPFALGLLYCWNSLTTERLSDATAALEALGLAVLLIWMNCRRAVFAGTLRRQLSGAPETPWTAGRIAKLVSTQAFLGSVKLVLLPLAALVAFPFAGTVAFFRNAAVLADSDELDGPQVIAKARALARIHQRQSWMVLAILLLLQLAILINLAITYAVLPFVVRMLTGYESAFNRGELYFVQSPLFLVFVLVTSWVAFDPFIQAVYCVRCFHGESVASGEDLRVGLRRIRAAQIAAALLLLAIPLRAAEGVSPKELEDSVRKTMQSPEYGWRIPPPVKQGAASKPWVVAVTDKVLDILNSGMKWIGKGIQAFFRWLGRQLGSQPEPQGGAAPVVALHWSIYLLIAAVTAGALWLAWRNQVFRRRKRQPTIHEGAAAIRLEEENVTADQLPEERWLELAGQYLREENYRLALRACYLANLAWLGRSGMISIHAGKTNREYELELRRRARAFPEARGLFGANVSAFEAAWYGMHDVSGESVQEFRGRLDGMKRAMA